MPEERPGKVSKNPPSTVIAFDYGTRRIGIAAGDTLTRTAAPRPAASVNASGPDWAAIGREIDALGPALLVVGAPYNADGSPGALTSAASAFAAELASRFGLPVQRVDERFSSLEASEALRARRASGARRRRVRPGDVDSAAAAIILGRWLGGEGFG
jgi:putative holliday junction resolvase